MFWLPQCPKCIYVLLGSELEPTAAEQRSNATAVMPTLAFSLCTPFWILVKFETNNLGLTQPKTQNLKEPSISFTIFIWL